MKGRTTSQVVIDEAKTRTKKRTGVRQYSVHLSEKIHRAARIALLIEGNNLDFSGLVERLLIEYLSKNKLPNDSQLVELVSLED
jgi:hypothetical protein